MNKGHILSIIFGTSLVLVILYEDLLWKTLWIYEPIILSTIGVGCFFILINAMRYRNWRVVMTIATSSLIAGAIYMSRSEWLKSEPVLEARLIDDLSVLNLTLREDNTFEIIPDTWIGTFEEFTGEYQIEGNRIIFLDKPYESNFIPDTVDIYNDKIILNGDISEPDTSFARYFEIQLNLLVNLNNCR